MQNRYDVVVNNLLHGYADVDNFHNHLLLNIEKIKREKCFIFVVERIYKDTKVKTLLITQSYIDVNNNLELVYNHILRFRIFENDFYNKSKIDNLCFLYKKVIRKLKRNKINIYYVKLVVHSNELS